MAVKKKFKLKKWRLVRLCVAVVAVIAVILLLTVRCDKGFESVYKASLEKSGIHYRSSVFDAENVSEDVPVPKYVKRNGAYRFEASVNGKNRKVTEALWSDARVATAMTVNGEKRYIAAVKYNEGWGYIVFRQEKNTLVYEELSSERFDNCEPFREGVAAVCKGGLYGIISIDGKYVIDPEYKEMRFCSKGLMPVSDGSEWFYVDMNNVRVLGPYAEAESFSADGFACVRDKKTGLFMYIDLEGNAVTEPIYENAWETADGIANVKLSGKWITVDIEE